MLRDKLHFNNGRSLFFKLLTSFTVVILLLVSFNTLSYTFFRNNIQEEIIINNSLNLNKTVNNYEYHIRQIKNIALSFYLNPKTEILKATSQPNYYVVSQLLHDIRLTVSNQFLHLNNLILFAKDSAFIIEKEGTSRAEDMFSKYYYSPAYGLDFWTKELESPVSFKIYPAAQFVERGTNDEISKGLLTPILVKNIYNPHFAVIALLDSYETYFDFHRSSPDDRFVIFDETLKPVFLPNNDAVTVEWADIRGSQGYFKKKNDYYFYQKGAESGFIYMSVIPNERISSQIARLNVILFVLSAISVVIGILTSIFFSRRFNMPLTKIIESIQHWNAERIPRSQIKEFDMIGEKLRDLVQTNNHIRQDLTYKNSLLRSYAYINKLKMIRTNFHEAKIPIDTNKPFLLLLCQLMFKRSFKEETGIELDKASYLIKEFIDSTISKTYPESLTFQIEKDQILSLIFAEDESSLHVMETVRQIKQVLDLDKNYCLATIAVSPVYTDSSDFSIAYEKILNMLNQRKLVNETQIITEYEPLPHPLTFSPAEEQEFRGNLLAGNDVVLLQLVKRTLLHLAKKDAPALHFAEFAKDVIQKVMNAFASLGLDLKLLSDPVSPHELAKDCHTPEQYASFFEQFLPKAAALIRQKKEATDPIANFVIQYIENHYSEDLSLDIVAEKLNITGAYLSTYFKEKTGINFSDYLNELRMNKAKQLLQSSDLRIQDVAARVGYHNVNSFIRMFKKVTGLSPGEFRKTAGS